MSEQPTLQALQQEMADIVQKADFNSSDAIKIDRLANRYLRNDKKKKVERIPDDLCRAEVKIKEDGTLMLRICIFMVNMFVHYVEIPFSDFAENFASLADFERMVVDLINLQFPEATVSDDKPLQSG